MLNIKMICFIFFIIFNFDFVVKVYGNRTYGEELLHKYIEYVKEYKIPLFNITRLDQLENHVTGTSHEPTTTSSATTQPPTEPTFIPLNHLVHTYLDLIKLFNKTVENQILLMYGEHRPEKYQYVANLLLDYFTSFIGNITNVTLSSSVQTPPSIDGYLQESTRKYQKTTTNVPETTFNIIQVSTTVKPLTQATQSLPTTLPNQHQAPHKAASNELGDQLPDQPEQHLSTFKPDQHQPENPDRQHTQYPSDQRGNQNYSSTWLGHQNVQYLSTPGQRVISDSTIWQELEYPVHPAYYDMYAFTRPSYITPKEDNLISGVTSPPSPSKEHPIIKDVKTKMATKKQGYFTAFLQELFTIIVLKNPRQSKELYDVLERVISKMRHEGQLLDLGKRFETAITSMLRTLTLLEPDVVQSHASIAIRVIEDKDTALDQDVLSLLHDIDNIYTVQEGEELLNTLVQVDEYPKNDSAFVVAESVVKNLFSPYFRIAGSQTRYLLIQSINRVMEKRELGFRKRIEDFDDRIFEKGLRNKNNGDRKYDKKGKVTNFFNDKERNEVIIKELIKNFKASEIIKKYETKIFQTTAKAWPSIYKIHEESSHFGRRANFGGTQPKNNEESNNLNRKTMNINFDNKKDKMADLDDGISKYKLKPIQSAKIKNITESRKNIHPEIDTENDGLYVSTSESESVPKTHQNKMDKHTKHKIINHLKQKHVKSYKSFKKRYERNKRRRTNVKNKVLLKNKEQKRLSVVTKHKKKLPFDDKTHANDNKRPLKTNKRHSNDKNRRLSDNRRLYGSKGRPTGANRRPPSANRRPNGANRRPPGANQLNSMYLTPRYEYNSRRFNENINLTRRSNAKQISTELSYSNEENDIKFHIQDAIRHPIDLKSKIQQNSLIFDKVQNVRRKMAPVDRISLKEESNYSDDEGMIKNNIYKVFNKNNN